MHINRNDYGGAFSLTSHFSVCVLNSCLMQMTWYVCKPCYIKKQYFRVSQHLNVSLRKGSPRLKTLAYRHHLICLWPRQRLQQQSCSRYRARHHPYHLIRQARHHLLTVMHISATHPTARPRHPVIVSTVPSPIRALRQARAPHQVAVPFTVGHRQAQVTL